MTPALAEAASHGDTRSFMTQAAKQMAGRTLANAAAQAVADGRTTVDEALRIAVAADDV